MSCWLSHDCPIASLDLGFLHPVPTRIAVCLRLGVPPPPVFPQSWLWGPWLLKLLSSYYHPECLPPCWKSRPSGSLQPSTSTCPNQNYYFSSTPSATQTFSSLCHLKHLPSIPGESSSKIVRICTLLSNLPGTGDPQDSFFFHFLEV